MSNDIYFSYTDNGFYHSFEAVKNENDSWTVHFLVVYEKDNKSVYLGEYTAFRRRVLEKIDILPLKDKLIVLEQIDKIYTSMIQKFLAGYTTRIRKHCANDISLYEYGQQMIGNIQEFINKFNIDLNVTRICQPDKITFHFIWNGNIVASYYINRLSDSDKLELADL